MLVSGCATTPVITPTMKSVAGTYELTQSGDIWRSVLLDNGTFEDYKKGNKREYPGVPKWEITKDGELH